MKKKCSFNMNTYEIDLIGEKDIRELKAKFIQIYDDALIPLY